jgi:hypothetical protein
MRPYAFEPAGPRRHPSKRNGRRIVEYRTTDLLGETDTYVQILPRPWSSRRRRR